MTTVIIMEIILIYVYFTQSDVSLNMNRFKFLNSIRHMHYGVTIILFLTTLIVYLITLPQKITSEDAGLFHMACAMGGIAHPPGYPLYISICQLVYQLPFNPVLMGNILSSLYASLSIAVIFHIARYYVKETIYAFLVAASYGFSLAFWSQAIIVEVYSLNILLFSLVWLVALKYTQTRSSVQFYQLAFCYGLALSNHWPLVVLSTPAILLVLAPTITLTLRKLKNLRFSCYSVLSLFAGLSPYLLLFFLGDPEISIGGELKTWRHVLGYILRTMYEDPFPRADWLDVVKSIVWITRESFLQLGSGGIAFILAGIIAGFRQPGLRVSLVLILLYAGSTWLLILVRQLDFNPHIQEIFRPYPLPAYLAVCFWYTLGVRWLVGLIHRHAPGVSWIVVPACLLSVFLSNYNQNNRSNDNLYDLYGRTVLNSLQTNSDLFLQGDTQIGIFGYLHHLQKLRNDVNLYSWDGVIFKNRLVPPYQPREKRFNKILNYITNSLRPTYSIQNAFGPAVDYGLYIRAHPSGGYEFLTDIDRYLDYILLLYEQDLLRNFKESRFVFNQLLAFSTQYSGYDQKPVPVHSPWHLRYQKLMATVPGKMVRFEADYKNGLDVSWKNLQDLEAQIPEYADSRLVSGFYFRKAEIARRKDLPQNIVVDALEESMDRWMDSDNPAACLLYQYYYQYYRQEAQDRKLNLMKKRLPEIIECQETSD